MERLIFNTPYTYKNEDHLPVPSLLPSLTVPDQSYSIREILQKFALGQALPIDTSNSVYEDDVDCDSTDLLPEQMNDVDFFDKVEIAKQAASRRKALEAELEELKNPKPPVDPPVDPPVPAE